MTLSGSGTVTFLMKNGRKTKNQPEQFSFECPRVIGFVLTMPQDWQFTLGSVYGTKASEAVQTTQTNNSN